MNDSPKNGHIVHMRVMDLAYRMSRDQRVQDNWALLRACEVAKSTGAPVLIAFNLVRIHSSAIF